MKRISPRKVNNICFVAGLLAVLFMGLPYLLLGEEAIVTYHDQLDGELIAYLLQAKHLFEGNTLPEFMNGVSKTALIPPAPACVLLFLGGNGYAGLVCMQLLGSVCGYLGMYLLVKAVVCGTSGDDATLNELETLNALEKCNRAQDAAGELSGRRTSHISSFIICGIAMLVGVLYAYLPFLPVYGLAQYGLPLLVWCLLQAKRGHFVKTAFVYAALYALNSSLVLVGFGVLGSMLLWILWQVWKQLHTKEMQQAKIMDAAKKVIAQNADAAKDVTAQNADEAKDVTAQNTDVAKKVTAQNVGKKDVRAKEKCRSDMRPLVGIWAIMLLIYIVENISLLKQTLGIGATVGELSHKAEYVLTPTDFFSAFWQGLTKGGQHSEDYHYLFLAGILVTVIIALICKVRKQLVAAIGVCLGWNVFFTLVAAVWDSGLGIALRTKLSALGAFQMNRLLWIAPCFWYLALACGLVLVVELVRKGKGSSSLQADACRNDGGSSNIWGNRVRRLVGAGCCVLMAGMLGITGVKVLLESNLKPNIQKLRNPEYAAFSFKDYYAIGVLEQVEAYLQEATGAEQAKYRVVSLGIDPAAALYHGFYCLDGYSNNYPLEYKHRFREIIAPELAKSEYLQDSFDNWGNRCYLFSAECPGYYTIEKNGFSFAGYTLDVESLKELVGAYPTYLLSAAYIQNAEETGLVLLREEPFETVDSYYRIFLYGLE